jgi:predicted DNA-binding transcriptional regulator AlpA
MKKSPLTQNVTSVSTENNHQIAVPSALPNILNHMVGFYRANQCAELLGISKSTFWLWSQQKKVQSIRVPQPIRLSAGVTVWKRSEIHAFYDQLAALGDSSTPPEAA